MTKRLLLFNALIVVTLTLAFTRQSQTATPVPIQTAAAGRSYVGSAACRDCHSSVYERWAKTRMANVVTDPRIRPQVVIPDFSKADPLLTFKLDDVALVYGSKWKQR